jgi:hypothetical protein
MRNWAGVKIYIVALCWVGVTLVLPVVNAHISLGARFLSKMCSTFYIGFCVDSNFEILDLANDDPHLHTVPQQIGVSKTKIGLLLLLPFYFLEFFKTNFIEEQLIVNLVLVLALTLLFLPMKKIQLLHFLWVESILFFCG